jgi:CRISPR system Cascade subunit CasA
MTERLRATDEDQAPPRGPSLLESPLFTIQTDPSLLRLTLVELLTGLLVGSGYQAFPALAAEHRPAWWRFLVRTAGHALKACDFDEVGNAAAVAEEELRERIHDALTEGLPPGAWGLHDRDRAAPAFFQPPGIDAAVSPQDLSELSPLIGSKEHDFKTGRVRDLEPESAVYSLVALQLGAAWGGPGHYPAPFASGGYCGSPFMGARLPGDLQATFRHDVGVLLRDWDKIRRVHGLRGSLWAVWTEPWDGSKESALHSTRLSPAFIPVARRVRLLPAKDGRYSRMLFQPSKAARIEDHTGGGFLGDPFTPYVEDGTAWKAHRVTAAGYHAREVIMLLFGAGRHKALPSPSVAALAKLPASTPGVEVVFEAYAVTQGGTEGFHRRIVPLPRTTRRLVDEPDRVREIFGYMEEQAKKARGILWAATKMYLTGDFGEGDGGATQPDKAAVQRPPARFDQKVESVLLQQLLVFAEREDLEWQVDWNRELHRMAVDAFKECLPELPARATERLEREVRSAAYLNGRLWSILNPDTAQDPVPA